MENTTFLTKYLLYMQVSNVYNYDDDITSTANIATPKDSYSHTAVSIFCV